MNADLITLARELIATPTWEWRVGMRATGHIDEHGSGSFLVEGTNVGVPLNVDQRYRKKRQTKWSVILDAIPDLDDDATSGILLEMLPLGWACSRHLEGASRTNEDQDFRCRLQNRTTNSSMS
jgi:hypothetical protein